MSYSTLTRFGPRSTPGIIKGLIIACLVTALFSAAIQAIFDQFGLRPGPQELLSLSWQGMRSFYLWQIVTFLFIQSSSSYGITFFYLVSLFFTMYLFWVLGSAVVERTGKGAFACFYFFCGCGAGVISLLLMPITGQYAMLAGIAPVILALLTVWSMAYPENEMLLFFLIPVQAKWLVSGLLAITLLVTLSHWDLPNLILYASATLLGYGYACTAWGWHSPFLFMYPLDVLLATVGLRLRRILALPSWMNKSQKGNKKPYDAAKVVDISTGRTVSKDDTFIDEMLSKISKYGESSLSWNERRRMKQISEQKMKDRNVK